ncbi:MAG: HD domain-containing protein [Thermodesulfobacteriota bacterium]
MNPILDSIALSPLGEKLTRHLFDEAAAFHQFDDGCHGLDHVQRVHSLALTIGRELAARPDILSAAAILHDIGRRFETESRGAVCHAAKGAELARPILRESGFSGDDADQVLHCIACHRFRGDRIPVSMEAKILFDADKLDSIGATGIGRAFLFAGQVGARLHNPNNDVSGTLSYSRDDTAYREYTVKLSKIKDRMLTEPGRRLANARHRFMERFFQQLLAEIAGEGHSRHHEET